jgi:hypothetical protein
METLELTQTEQVVNQPAANTNEQGPVIEAAGAIQRYLADRPNAAETVEGVARWWLSRQRHADTVELVERALAYLERQGQVVRFHLAGGITLYRRA